MSPRRNPTDVHVLSTVLALGSVKNAAEHYGISEMSIRHRLHRLYQEKGISGKDGRAQMALAVWLCRGELEALAA
jgi:hypothetical protein